VRLHVLPQTRQLLGGKRLQLSNRIGGAAGPDAAQDVGIESPGARDDHAYQGLQAEGTPGLKRLCQSMPRLVLDCRHLELPEVGQPARLEDAYKAAEPYVREAKQREAVQVPTDRPISQCLQKLGRHRRVVAVKLQLPQVGAPEHEAEQCVGVIAPAAKSSNFHRAYERPHGLACLRAQLEERAHVPLWEEGEQQREQDLGQRHEGGGGGGGGGRAHERRRWARRGEEGRGLWLHVCVCVCVCVKVK
jgi:hypothetical protein